MRRRPREAARGRRRAARFPSTAPTCPEGGALDAAGRWPARHRPDLAASSTGSTPRCSPTRTASCRAAFQQTSGTVMAKGVEDTTFYRWNRFVALNEVGGAPDRFGVSPAEFHAARRAREARPARDHDDAVDARHQASRGRPGPARRARRAAPASGPAAVRRWSARHPLPDRSLAICWLAGPGRRVADRPRPAARPTSTKAAQEAEARTSQSRPMPEVRRGGRGLARRGARRRRGVPRSRRSSPRIARPAGRTRWAQKLVQLAMPGVPDVYQGTELWDGSLVDPDNRRPVDFGGAARRCWPRSTRLAAGVDATGRRSCW